MVSDTLDDQLIKLLINKLIHKNFHNLADDLGDVLVLLEVQFLYRDHGAYKASKITKVLDICAKEIDYSLNNSKETIIEDIEKSIIRAISLIEGAALIKT